MAKTQKAAEQLWVAQTAIEIIMLGVTLKTKSEIARYKIEPSDNEQTIW